MRRAVAIGDAHAVTQLARSLRGQPSTGYILYGACAPEGATYPQDAVIPRLGAVADVRQVCEDVSADAVVVADGAACSSPDLRRIASELKARDIELLVARPLGDVLGSPKVRMYPVAGLPLLRVRYGRAPEARGRWGRFAGFARPFVAPVLVALPMVALVAAVLWLGPR